MPRVKCWVGRRNAVANEECKYQQHVKAFSMSPSSSIGASKAGFLNRPPPLKTSSTFDNDDAFAAVARAMLYRYENEGQSERDAVHATLITAAEKRAFLEALDLRNVEIYATEHQSELEENAFHRLVQRVTTIFGDTMREMWRESQCRDVNNESSACGRTAATLASSSNRYRKAPPSPKNALQHKSSTVSAQSNDSENSAGSRNRRRFFPDSDSSRRCRTRIRFDWKLTTPEPVQSLQLDGSLEDPPTPQRKSLYEPPSPVESALRRLAH